MMTDNPWLPIDTMPLSTVGTSVDICDEKRLHAGVRVSGIRYERDVVVEHEFGGKRHFRIGRIDDFTIVTTTGDINVTTEAEWRPHA